MASSNGGRFRELLKKYGKVALGVHFSVSAASITGLYIAIKNNVDVESLLHKVGMSGVSTKDEQQQQLHPPPTETLDEFVIEERPSSENQQPTLQKRNRTAELAATSGGALALAVLCNKALFPIRVPITIALTPPVARFLARRRIIKNNVWPLLLFFSLFHTLFFLFTEKGMWKLWFNVVSTQNGFWKLILLEYGKKLFLGWRTETRFLGGLGFGYRGEDDEFVRCDWAVLKGLVPTRFWLGILAIIWHLHYLVL